ncbi:MAG TPA: phenylalanine--tRNA ligase beta subunit-related protein [Tepidisphaeraceae bacterium]|jgi:DNA/RNA-binding domain of Phe-tRNA-synthetase-like protein
MDLRIDFNDADFRAGVVVARGVTVAPAPPDLAARLDDLIARRSAEDFPPPPVKDAVRAMLRKGGFKPAGRNKPASEYLAQCAREGRFPRINNLVDINNLLSLESGLPISLLDLAAVGENVEIRCGRHGERYVFNPTGQEIELEGLICVCARQDDGVSIPLGNPIKDSMTGKLKDHTRDVIGVIYSSIQASCESTLQIVVDEFAQLLTRFGAATQADGAVYPRLRRS